MIVWELVLGYVYLNARALQCLVLVVVVHQIVLEVVLEVVLMIVLTDVLEVAQDAQENVLVGVREIVEVDVKMIVLDNVMLDAEELVKVIVELDAQIIALLHV
jgi:hypothetical protein